MSRSMSHFAGDCKAIVIATYAEQYGHGGGDIHRQYTLHILKRGHNGQSSWYAEDQLTLIEPDRFDLLPKSDIHRKVWEAKKAREAVK